MGSAQPQRRRHARGAGARSAGEPADQPGRGVTRRSTTRPTPWCSAMSSSRRATTRVQAEHAHATGLNFANSKLDLRRQRAHRRRAARQPALGPAVVEFRTIASRAPPSTASPPSSSRSAPAPTQMARGHADKIVYDVGEGTVRLTERRLALGRRRTRSPARCWSTTSARSACRRPATPGADQRVHITIAPHTRGRQHAGKAATAEPRGPRRRKPPAEPTAMSALQGHAACAKSYKSARSCATCRSRSPTARSSDCSDPTAPARPPRST